MARRCRNKSGQFIKCSKKKGAKKGAKKGTKRCRTAKGRFKKC